MSGIIDPGSTARAQFIPDTTTDLAAAIRAKVAEERAKWLAAPHPSYPASREAWLAQCDLADAILALCDTVQDDAPALAGALRRGLVTAWGVET